MKRLSTLTCTWLALLLLLASGCETDMPRSYGGLFGDNLSNPNISPVYPEMGGFYPDRFRVINTLTPELKWTDRKNKNQTYDLCIWEAPYISDADVKRGETLGSWGRPVYVVTGLLENHHGVGTSLKPMTYYHWAVRIHDGAKVGKWSSYSQVGGVIGLAVISHANQPFCFKTPAK